jgi:hypothetical protein
MKGKKGFQKGHEHFKGAEKGWFNSDRVAGEKNVNWRGDEVSYTHIHTWINRHKEKKECEDCGAIFNLQMANISREYKRDVNDWRVLCAKCHAKFDDRKIHYRDSKGRIIKKPIQESEDQEVSK